MKTNRQPFQDTIDTDLFFGGGSRREIVDKIKAALADDVELLTLTGTDGSGKTMICTLVQQELEGNAEVLYFDRGAESFDDVVNTIAAQVELEDTDKIPDRNTRLEKAVELLHQQNRRLIIILDGAENIFLATLERIRRMIDQVNGPQLSMQLLFSGRPLFSLNYKQLSIISFKVVEEQHFTLDPLDGRDTHLYLNHSLDLSDTEEQKRFSLTQAEEIADIARGNFRLINQLAGKFLDLKRLAEVKEEAPEEDYDEDDDSSEAGGGLSSGLGNVDLDFLKVPKIGVRWYAAGAGIVALIFLILLLRGGDEQEIEPLPGSEDVPELTLEKVEPDPIDIPQPSQPLAPLPPPAPSVAPEESQPTVVESSPPVEPSETVDVTVESAPVETTGEQAEAATEEISQAPETAVEEAPATDLAVESESVTEQIESEESPDIPVAEVREEEVIAAEEASAPAEEEIKVAETDPAAEEVAEPVVAAPVEETAESPEGPEPVPAEVVAEVTEEIQAVSSEEVVEVPEQPAARPDVSEESGAVEEQVSEESLSIPKITVLNKKQPPAESKPLTVVTLRDESKLPPDQSPALAPATTEVARAEEVPAPAEEPQPPVVAEQETESTPTEAQPERVAVVEPAEEEVTTPPVTRSQSQLIKRDPSVYYAQRLAAGSRWLVGGSRDKYTVQLMVLNSEDAQQNVRYMLAEEDYQKVLDQLYILRKVGQPQTVMLYWGEFDSPSEARAARSQLPNFLSRLEPFEIPVKDAVAKARAGQ